MGAQSPALQDLVEPYSSRRARADGERRGIALCLSGGGFRAALFHLGALRRLDELGVLGAVETVSAVSGGSVLAAFLAERLAPWPEPGCPSPAWEEQVARPCRELTSRGMRTWPLLARWGLPWNWLRPEAAVEALASVYRRRLTSRDLRQLPTRPSYVLCATDLTFGVNFELRRQWMGDWQVGYQEPPVGFPLARAVAASSCFPPVFAPLRLGLDPARLAGGAFPPGHRRDRLVSGLRLSDGGLYDNLGLEPVWKDHRVVLVSDGGAPFGTAEGGGSLRRLRRYAEIAARQGAALRKRWLISSFRSGALEGAYWGIGSATERYGAGAPRGYPAALVEGLISRVRTDLDGFTAEEAGVLENHGYLLAEAAIQRHLPARMGGTAPLSPPHPELLSPDRVARALRLSHRRLAPSRWLAGRRAAPVAPRR